MKAQQTNLMKRVLVSLLLCGIMVFLGFQVSGEEWTDAQKELWKTTETSWKKYESLASKMMLVVSSIILPFKITDTSNDSVDIRHLKNCRCVKIITTDHLLHFLDNWLDLPI